MPVPSTKQAPDFDSKNPEDLKEFLEEFEKLAERNGLTVKEKAKMVVKYVDKETKAFWKRGCTAAMSPQSFTNHSHTHMVASCDLSCHFCKRVDCCMRTCPEAAEYVRWGWVILQSNGYYAYPNRSYIR
ncbi:hypothetical protein AN958_09772 [Leucoagaricus sp. SymC.cos]|nr:hypothetical protein AN958_09772 [Leucoagaricus sp. SymC.cos]